MMTMMMVLRQAQPRVQAEAVLQEDPGRCAEGDGASKPSRQQQPTGVKSRDSRRFDDLTRENSEITGRSGLVYGCGLA